MAKKRRRSLIGKPKLHRTPAPAPSRRTPLAPVAQPEGDPMASWDEALEASPADGGPEDLPEHPDPTDAPPIPTGVSPSETERGVALEEEQDSFDLFDADPDSPPSLGLPEPELAATGAALDAADAPTRGAAADEEDTEIRHGQAHIEASAAAPEDAPEPPSSALASFPPVAEEAATELLHTPAEVDERHSTELLREDTVEPEFETAPDEEPTITDHTRPDELLEAITAVEEVAAKRKAAEAPPADPDDAEAALAAMLTSSLDHDAPEASEQAVEERPSTLLPDDDANPVVVHNLPEDFETADELGASTDELAFFDGDHQDLADEEDERSPAVISIPPTPGTYHRQTLIAVGATIGVVALTVLAFGGVMSSLREPARPEAPAAVAPAPAPEPPPIEEPDVEEEEAEEGLAEEELADEEAEEELAEAAPAPRPRPRPRPAPKPEPEPAAVAPAPKPAPEPVVEPEPEPEPERRGLFGLGKKKK